MKVTNHSDDVHELARDIAQLMDAPEKGDLIYKGLIDCMHNAKGSKGKTQSLLDAGDSLFETLEVAQEDLISAVETGNIENHKNFMSTVSDMFGQNDSESDQIKLKNECDAVSPTVWKDGPLELKHKPLVGVLLSIFIQSVQRENGAVQDYITKLYDVADMLENYTEVVF